MALDKAQLKQSIYNAFVHRFNGSPTGTQLNEVDMLAVEIADAIDAFVKQAQVNYITGLVGTHGPVSGMIQHTIS
ncbi:MAG: hypothetical protein JST88_09365 [Bacteroidetes bacterium]|nr:hypothetical protein [Bacteroidota bacterium]